MKNKQSYQPPAKKKIPDPASGYPSGNTRRDFLKNGAALITASVLHPLSSVLPAVARAVPAATGQIIGIQVGPESFVDEGTGKLLDLLNEQAAVNTISLTTFTYGQGFAGRQPAGRLYPYVKVEQWRQKTSPFMAVISQRPMKNSITTRSLKIPVRRIMAPSISSPKYSPPPGLGE